MKRYLCSFLLLLMFGRANAAPLPLVVLHTFDQGGSGGIKPAEEVNTDGARPEAPLLESRDGFLYGSTSSGGAGGTGVLFKVKADGSGFRVLHAFGLLPALFSGAPNSDGARPHGALVQDEAGTLYGTAQQGGPQGGGTVFKLNADGSGYQVLHAFGPMREMFRSEGGASPCGIVLGKDGLLYGAATLGGADGKGLIFRLRTDGGGFTTLHLFGAVKGKDNVNDGGALPGSAPVFGQDGNLYGTANIGGKTGYGLLFRLSPNGERFTILHQFQREGTGFEANGVFPEGALVPAKDGSLYGSTRQGGRYDRGILFQMDFKRDASGRFRVLHTFGPADAGLPDAPSLSTDGSLYGVTASGGQGGSGVLYHVAADGSQFAILHAFGQSLPQGQVTEGQVIEGQATEGTSPHAGVLDVSSGAFYSVTDGGGGHGTGTVFRVLLPPDNEAH